MGPYRTPGPSRKRCHSRNNRACSASSVAAETFRVGGLADFQYAQDISFEMSPTELADAFMVLQVSGTAVTTENAGVYFTQ